MALEVRPVTAEELPSILPLIAAYQEFYEVDPISPEQNAEFFSRFIGSSHSGWLYAAWDGGLPIGFGCYYRHKSSLTATSTVLMHDLYVNESARGQGVGRKLIEVGCELAREIGAPMLVWSTAPDNSRAQALYDSTGAEKSAWIEYELEV